MADEPQENITPTPQQENNPTPKPQSPHGDEKQIDWKAESRKWEERSKSNAKAAAELADLRQSQEAAEKKNTELQSKLDELTRANKLRDMRSQVSQEKHVPADLLQGASLDQMRDYADKLIAWATPSANTPIKLGNEPKAAPNPNKEFIRNLFNNKS